MERAKKIVLPFLIILPLLTFLIGREAGARAATEQLILRCVFNQQNAPVAFAVHMCTQLFEE